MKKMLKKSLAMLLALVMVFAMVACGSGKTEETKATVAANTGNNTATEAAGETAKDPIKITMYYADNPTLPYMDSWLTVVETAKLANIDLTIEAIPTGTDYTTKVALALNTGENCPDVILYQTTQGENASLAVNGAIVPISDYSDWTPNFNAMVEKLGLTDDVNALRLGDGKLYYMPALRDAAQYDGGLIMRQDYLDAKGFDAPKTFDDLYEILKAYKEDYPDSYPLTTLVAPYVTYRMTMPAWGISFGKSSSSGSNALSYNYETGEYFIGSTSDEAKEYLTFMHKLYAEGLLDPEMAPIIDDATWSSKMTSGYSMATYAYYDQIGGLEAASEIEGFDLQLYPSLEGPAGAHHQPKTRTSAGVLFPAATAERDDFEDVVRAVDKMFYSEEAVSIWHLGVEGVTYTKDGDDIVFIDEIANASEGVFKYMQVKYGCGADPLQMVWINEIDMKKYDKNYEEINAAVASMDNVIQSIPPTPLFDEDAAEEVSAIQSTLIDTIEVWIDNFVSGKKSLDTDWDAYVAELESLQVERYCELYNEFLAK